MASGISAHRQGLGLVPDITFKTRVRDDSIDGDNPYRWEDVTSHSLFAHRRVVLFSLPGAFTPVCSGKQCPAYEAAYEQIRACGIDEVYCISVNDAFVMFQWGRHLGIQKVKLIPDGSGHFTRRMGMLVSKDHLGFGFRSWRYSMVINDGDIECLFVEPGINDAGLDDDPYEVSSPEKMLDYLRTRPTES